MPVEGSDEVKQTNEIGLFIPLLDSIDIQDKDITADALLTQRHLATYVTGRGSTLITADKRYFEKAKGAGQITLLSDFQFI